MKDVKLSFYSASVIEFKATCLVEVCDLGLLLRITLGNEISFSNFLWHNGWHSHLTPVYIQGGLSIELYKPGTHY